MGWLLNFFYEAFKVVPPLGLAAFAMLVIVALVAIIVTIAKASPAPVSVVAILSVVVILGLNQLWGVARSGSIQDHGKRIGVEKTDFMAQVRFPSTKRTEERSVTKIIWVKSQHAGKQDQLIPRQWLRACPQI
jgi:hypothetical protein